MPFGEHKIEVFIDHLPDGRMALRTESGPLPEGFAVSGFSVYGKS